MLSNEDLAGIAAVGQAGNVNSRRDSSSRRGASRGTSGRESTSTSTLPRADTPERQSVRDRLRNGSEEARSGAAARQGSVRNPAAGGGSGGGRRYIPSQRSTASLRLELLEEPSTGAGVTRGL